MVLVSICAKLKFDILCLSLLSLSLVNLPVVLCLASLNMFRRNQSTKVSGFMTFQSWVRDFLPSTVFANHVYVLPAGLNAKLGTVLAGNAIKIARAFIYFCPTDPELDLSSQYPNVEPFISKTTTPCHKVNIKKE